MVVRYTKIAKMLFWSALHITFIASSERVNDQLFKIQGLLTTTFDCCVIVANNLIVWYSKHQFLIFLRD